jgi:FKBP-type peptidyl-prolyl cis-trans isomerase
MKPTTLATACGILTVALAGAPLMAQDLDLDAPKARAGYSIGVNIGMNVGSQLPADEIDMDALVAGISDAISGNLQMSEQEIMVALQEFSQQQQAKMQAEAEASTAENKQFLEENGKRSEVTTTDSGLQYEVLSKGDQSTPMPSSTDTVNVHYQGTLIDGTVFDSSIERGQPLSIPLNGVIPGWTEGIQLMHVGDKFRFFIPSDLAYGENGAGDAIGPNATLIFDVELLGIE